MFGKQSRQVTCADMGRICQVGQRPCTNRVLRDRILCAMHRRMHVIAVRQPRRKLRILARAALIHDLPARHAARQFGAGVTLDQIQGKVDSGGDAGAGQDRSVVHEHQFEAVRRILGFDASFQRPKVFYPAREGRCRDQTTIRPSGATVMKRPRIVEEKSVAYIRAYEAAVVETIRKALADAGTGDKR